MPNYRIEAHGEARELYSVTAEDETEARALFEAGKVDKAFLTEVSGAEIISIEEEDC